MDHSTTSNPNKAHTGDAFEIADKNKWYGQELGVESDPMIDPGTGKPYVLRAFEFSFNPDFLKQVKRYGTQINKQELFNSNWRQMQTMLWGDGLVAYEDVEPRILLGKKKYRIFILCKPRLSTFIAEKPRNLQEVLNPKK